MFINRLIYKLRKILAVAFQRRIEAKPQFNYHKIINNIETAPTFYLLFFTKTKQ